MLQELLDQQAALDRQIKELKRASREQVIADVKALMAQHGLTPSDLIAATPTKTKRAQSSRAKVAAKYRDPVTGDTWTGRGLKPRWLTAKLNDGAKAEDFLI